MLTLPDLCAQLGFTVTRRFISDTLGIEPDRCRRKAVFYSYETYTRIVIALRDYLSQITVVRQARIEQADDQQASFTDADFGLVAEPSFDDDEEL